MNLTRVDVKAIAKAGRHPPIVPARMDVPTIIGADALIQLLHCDMVNVLPEVMTLLTSLPATMIWMSTIRAMKARCDSCDAGRRATMRRAAKGSVTMKINKGVLVIAP